MMTVFVFLLIRKGRTPTRGCINKASCTVFTPCSHIRLIGGLSKCEVGHGNSFGICIPFREVAAPPICSLQAANLLVTLHVSRIWARSAQVVVEVCMMYSSWIYYNISVCMLFAPITEPRRA